MVSPDTNVLNDTQAFVITAYHQYIKDYNFDTIESIEEGRATLKRLIERDEELLKENENAVALFNEVFNK